MIWCVASMGESRYCVEERDADGRKANGTHMDNYAKPKPALGRRPAFSLVPLLSILAPGCAREQARMYSDSAKSR
jgi:hypothetical protein